METYYVQVEEDPKAPMPFRMIEWMMPGYWLVALMGFMFVFAALLIGIFALNPAFSDFFADSKAVRESAGSGSSFVDANVLIHQLETWVPPFKFLGLGLGLLAINMALGLIARRLRRMGQVVNAYMRLTVPSDNVPSLPAIPSRVRVMQASAMMGIMTLMATFIIGLILAYGVVTDYYDHSIGGELNGAQPGSQLMDQLSTVSSLGFWLGPLQMLGMAFLLTGIVIALSVIISVLRAQNVALSSFTRNMRGVA